MFTRNSPNYKSHLSLKNALEDTQYLAFLNRNEKLPWGEGFRNLKIETAADEIRAIRNESIVAHGTKPVSQEIAGLSLAVGELYLNFTFKKAALLQTYPFKGTENVQTLCELAH